MRAWVSLTTAFIAAASLFAGDLPRDQIRSDTQHPVADVRSIFRPFYDGVIPDERLAAVRAALPYDRISVERSGGLVIPGGRFKLTLAKGGEATLSSEQGNPFGRSGEFVGMVGIFDFGKVSHLIDRVGFERLDRRYASHWTDMQTETVTVSTPTRTIVVADYGGAAPVEMWSIEQALEAIGHNIMWRQK